MKKSYLYMIILLLLFFIFNFNTIVYQHVQRYQEVLEENKLIKDKIKLKEEFEKKLVIIEKNKPSIGGDLWEIYDAILDGETEGLEERIEGLPDNEESMYLAEKVKNYGLERYKWRIKGLHSPVIDEYAFVTSEYGVNYIWDWNKEEKRYVVKKRTHRGVDIASSYDISVYSSAIGVINKVVKNDIWFGNYIQIYHEIEGKGIMTCYAHLTDIFVEKGDVVNFCLDEKGKIDIENSTLIGTMGNSGNSLGRHLHFEVWVHGKYGWRTINPYLNSTHKTRVFDKKYKSHMRENK